MAKRGKRTKGATAARGRRQTQPAHDRGAARPKHGSLTGNLGIAFAGLGLLLTAYLTVLKWAGDAPAYCGAGFASEAASAVVAHARDDLGIATLTAIVSPENMASIGLIKKLGLSFDRGITMPGEDNEISLYSMRLT